ncbi:MAG: class I SAM-dependent methyltransferase [Oscillospiraceae bacterium]|nr:class I SAM-dependent methyltransferase [Oscillospiraceae bacterium]
MKNESKTLYIPLYGKALVSRKGIILQDKKAEEIWEKERFSLGAKSRSKWLAYFMGMRAAVIDGWLCEKLLKNPESIVIHIGCGLDSRIERVKAPYKKWYDVDLPEVTAVRRRYYEKSEKYEMLGASAAESEWIFDIADSENAVVVMEGISMYLSEEAIANLFSALSEKFPKAEIIMDVYTTAAVKATRYKNPIKDVDANAFFGVDDPLLFEKGKIRFSKEICMTPADKINELSGFEKAFFKKMFAGSFAKGLYKIYTYNILSTEEK